MTTYDDQSQTERELREALADRAGQIHPSSRLDAILREASAPEANTGRGRWVAGLGVAAAAATLVAGTVWASRPDTDPTLPGGAPSSSARPTPTVTSPAPTPSASPSPSTSPSSTSSTATPDGSTTSTMAQAIYRVGTNGGADDRPGLVREYRTASVGSTETSRVKSAVVEALTRTDLWRGVHLMDLKVTQSAITLRLGGAGADAPDASSARLAAYALVWSAQGAVGRGDLPVSILPADGGRLLGQLDSSKPFTRAGTPPEALCDIWIDNPSPGADLPQTKSVVVRGQAVAWEANVEWQLRRGTTSVRTGFVTASVGAPSRGTFSVDLGQLDAGTYTFRAFTSSAKDGSAVAERLVTFTVR